MDNEVLKLEITFLNIIALSPAFTIVIVNNIQLVQDFTTSFKQVLKFTFHTVSALQTIQTASRPNSSKI